MEDDHVGRVSGIHNTNTKPKLHPKWHSQPKSNRPPRKQHSPQESHAQQRTNVQRTFIQPSAIASGDKGIFVTCDKGKEKRCMIELGDMVEEYLDNHGLLEKKVQGSQEMNTTGQTLDNNDSSDNDAEIDIESAISSELSSLRQPTQNNSTTNPNTTPPKPFQLITLDIPCVSFLRFHPSHPSYPFINPTTIAHTLSENIMSTGQFKSRFVSRLSPMMWIGKVLNQGLERGCEEVIDEIFKIRNPAITHSGYTFAIRTTIRNNNDLSRDEIIRFVADRIKDIGQDRHKVDLKNYELGVLIEVYRGWIGMSVVENLPWAVRLKRRAAAEAEGRIKNDKDDHAMSGPEEDSVEVDDGNMEYKYGFEELKRFNLAEVATEVMIRNEKKSKEKVDMEMNG